MYIQYKLPYFGVLLCVITCICSLWSCILVIKMYTMYIFPLSLLRTYPVHDSTSILLVRSANYRKHVESVREWYSTQHHNWQQVDGERSRWWVWEKTREVALTSARHIQHYLARITSGEYIQCIS